MKINTIKNCICLVLFHLSVYCVSEEKIRVVTRGELQGFYDRKATIIGQTNCALGYSSNGFFSFPTSSLPQVKSSVDHRSAKADYRRNLIAGNLKDRSTLVKANECHSISVAGIEFRREDNGTCLVEPFVIGGGSVMLFPDVFPLKSGHGHLNSGYYHLDKDNAAREDASIQMGNTDLLVLASSAVTDSLFSRFIHICVKAIIKHHSALNNSSKTERSGLSLARLPGDTPMYTLVHQYVKILTSIRSEGASEYFLATTLVFSMARWIQKNDTKDHKIFEGTVSGKLLDELVDKNTLNKDQKEDVKTQLDAIANILRKLFCNTQGQWANFTLLKANLNVFSSTEKCDKFKEFYTRIDLFYLKRTKRWKFVLYLLTHLSQSFSNPGHFKTIFTDKLKALRTEEDWLEVLNSHSLESLKNKDDNEIPKLIRDQGNQHESLGASGCTIFDFVLSEIDKDPSKSYNTPCLDNVHSKLQLGSIPAISSTDIEGELKRILRYFNQLTNESVFNKYYPTKPVSLRDLLKTNTNNNAPINIDMGPNNSKNIPGLNNRVII